MFWSTVEKTFTGTEKVATVERLEEDAEKKYGLKDVN